MLDDLRYYFKLTLLMALVLTLLFISAPVVAFGLVGALYSIAHFNISLFFAFVVIFLIGCAGLLLTINCGLKAEDIT